MKRLLALTAAIGCGGGGLSNPALEAQFAYDYGNWPVSLPVLQATISSMLAASAAPTAENALNLADLSPLTVAFLAAQGSIGTANFGAKFDVPGCATAGASSVKMAGCTITLTDPSGPGTVKIDGSLSVSGGRSLSWDISVNVAQTLHGTGTNDGPFTGKYHSAGAVSLTPATGTADASVDGTMLEEQDVTLISSSRPTEIAVAEAVKMTGFAYRSGTSFCVGGGTLIVTSVFTRSPNPVVPLCAHSAKLTLGGCTSTPGAQHSTGC